MLWRAHRRSPLRREPQGPILDAQTGPGGALDLGRGGDQGGRRVDLHGGAARPIGVGRRRRRRRARGPGGSAPTPRRRDRRLQRSPPARLRRGPSRRAAAGRRRDPHEHAAAAAGRSRPLPGRLPSDPTPAPRPTTPSSTRWETPTGTWRRWRRRFGIRGGSGCTRYGCRAIAVTALERSTMPSFSRSLAWLLDRVLPGTGAAPCRAAGRAVRCATSWRPGSGSFRCWRNVAAASSSTPRWRAGSCCSTSPPSRITLPSTCCPRPVPP